MLSRFITNIFILYSFTRTLEYVTATANVGVPSCSVVQSRKVDCGYPTEETCVNNDCCWEVASPGIPSCYAKEIRLWGECSAKCRHRGKPGKRVELERGWALPCNSFPCHLNTVCLCQRLDVLIIADASESVGELNFWGRKQLIIDIVMAYHQIGHDTRFSFVTFDSTATVVFDFNAGYSLDNYHETNIKVWETVYLPKDKGKHMSEALLTAADIFTTQGRPDVKHLCLVITNGQVTKSGQIPNAVEALRIAGATVHVVYTGQLIERGSPVPDEELMHSLTTSDLHVFSISDYKSETSIVTALVTEWCCEGGLKNSINARFDDDAEIYVNGEYKDFVTFHETGIFTVEEGRNNLVALRIINKLNPLGRYFEIWNTAHKGLSLLSLPFQWKCTHREYPGWYGVDYDDNNWEQAVLSRRDKDRLYVGDHGQKRLWTADNDTWTAYCRGWVVGVCNVTYMPGVECTSTGPIMEYGMCSNAYDGEAYGRGGEWITNLADVASINIKFSRRSSTIREVGILNRCSLNGQAKDLSIRFSDGSVHTMELACNAYSNKATHCDGINWAHMTFDPPVTSDFINVTIISACDGVGRRKGLREIQVLGDPPCY